jgi:hypothetical protein
MQSNARKIGRTIESLLIKHTKLDKTAARLASEHPFAFVLALILPF